MDVGLEGIGVQACAVIIYPACADIDIAIGDVRAAAGRPAVSAPGIGVVKDDLGATGCIRKIQTGRVGPKVECVARQVLGS
ncbi:hypothetical protein LP7551_01777 [Roseibium album]|nr:hypothetical protein LP7551_01777 [Roseibium album]